MSIKILNKFDRITVGDREFDCWDLKLYKLDGLLRIIQAVLIYRNIYWSTLSSIRYSQENN